MNVAVTRRNTVGIAEISNIGQSVETKILEESSSEHSKVSGQDLELSEAKILKTTLQVYIFTFSVINLNMKIFQD